MTDHNNNDQARNDDEARFGERTRQLISSAVAGLSAEDRAERIAYCREHNEHGVRMFPGDRDDVLEFRWGGKTLAMVRSYDLDSDAPLASEFIAEVPDTIPDDI